MTTNLEREVKRWADASERIADALERLATTAETKHTVRVGEYTVEVPESRRAEVLQTIEGVVRRGGAGSIHGRLL